MKRVSTKCTRIKHYTARVSIRMYDKLGIVLRIETIPSL